MSAWAPLAVLAGACVIGLWWRRLNITVAFDGTDEEIAYWQRVRDADDSDSRKYGELLRKRGQVFVK